jgi:hypothetical protein
MANLKVNRAIFAFTLLVFLSGLAYAADSLYRPNIFFLGITTDQGQYSAGSNLTIETTAVNEGSNPQVNMTLSYKIRRENDGAMIRSSSESLELGSREARTLKKIISIPPMILPGNYEVLVEALSTSGTPIASIFKIISIDANSSQREGVLFKEGEFYLEVPITQAIADGITETKIKYMYGFVGDTIPKGNPISAHFGLVNPGNVGLDLLARLEIVPSYSKSNPATEPQIIEERLGYLESGADKNSSISFSIDKPGTYSVIIAIYSKDKFLCQKEIRAVISGEDGSLLDIKNSKATYLEGEPVKVEVSFVGPADKSLVEGTYVQLKIKSDGREIESLENSPITLSSQPGMTQFKLNAPEELKNYDLEISLGKGSEVFDSVAQSYHPIDPNLTIANDGRIIPSNVSGCFDDGACAESESKLGDCLDCQAMNKTAERQETENFEFYKNAALVLVGIILLLIIVVWWYKR